MNKLIEHCSSSQQVGCARVNHKSLVRWSGLLFIAAIFILNINSANGLSRYCSAVNKTHLMDAFKNCSRGKYMVDFKGSPYSTSTIKYDDDYHNIISLLDRILTSIGEGNSSKNETKYLFLDLLRVVEQINKHDQLKYCIAELCNLFKNCEFPIDIEYEGFEYDAVAASRLAAVLTAYSFNEKFENKVYLTRLNLYSLLHQTLRDNLNIYDSKIFFKSGSSEQGTSLQGVKNLDDKSIEIGNSKQIREPTKNFAWFFKFITEPKVLVFNSTVRQSLIAAGTNLANAGPVPTTTSGPLGSSTAKWKEKFDLPTNEFDGNQIKQINQMIYPTAELLTTQRYVSHITYDCLRAIWNRIVSVPFYYPNGEIRGVVAVSISLNNFDLKQCGASTEDDELDADEDFAEENSGASFISKSKYSLSDPAESEADSESRTKKTKKAESLDDPFYDTDKCDRVSTICRNIPNLGFVLDSYECECKKGYYSALGNEYLDQSTQSKSTSASPLRHYNNKAANKSRIIQHKCLKCAKGCDTCVDSRPCLTELPENFKRTTVIINLSCMFICVILVILTWYHMTLKVLKTSSPKMLFMVLFGAIVSYSEIIPMYFKPSVFTCTLAQILQLEGFLLAYGALVLKTWRECKLFYVRSVKTIKITDQSLMKRLGIIMLVGTVYLAVWTFIKDRPTRTTVKDDEGLKYDTCTTTEWNFISMAIQITILLYGAFLSIQVRRASIAFKETKLITWAIFNECVVSCFVLSINVLLKYTPVSVYAPYTMSFLRIHLAITVMLLLLFSYKIYTIIMARKKPMQSNQSSNLMNSFTVSAKDGEDKNGAINDETDKERELKIEIHRLYRQLEEMRSLSMRIANPHLLTKKSRFISYPTKKKEKSSKLKHNQFLNSDNELSKALMSNNNTVQVDPITVDHKSYAIENENTSMVTPQHEEVSAIHMNKLSGTPGKNKK